MKDTAPQQRPPSVHDALSAKINLHVTLYGEEDEEQGTHRGPTSRGGGSLQDLVNVWSGCRLMKRRHLVFFLNVHPQLIRVGGVATSSTRRCTPGQRQRHILFLHCLLI